MLSLLNHYDAVSCYHSRYRCAVPRQQGKARQCLINNWLKFRCLSRAELPFFRRLFCRQVAAHDLTDDSRRIRPSSRLWGVKSAASKLTGCLAQQRNLQTASRKVAPSLLLPEMCDVCARSLDEMRVGCHRLTLTSLTVGSISLAVIGVALPPVAGGEILQPQYATTGWSPGSDSRLG